VKAANGQLPKRRDDVRLYLFHGPDEAGAADLARRLIAGLGEAERVDVEGASLKKDPGRLADEAASVSLFGDARVIRATGLGEDAVEAATLLLDASLTGAPVVATASPSLKSSAKLVKLALDHPRALAVACYAPTGAELERLVGTMFGEQGLRAAPGVAQQIAEAAGEDRAVIAREVEKLALYLDAAPERPRDVTAADLAAIGADLGEAAQGEAIEALVAGRAGELGAALARLDEAGSAIPWLRGLARRLVALGEMRAQIDRGEPVERVVKANRVHFREEASTTAALRRWTPAMLAEALARLREAERAVMAANTAGAVLAERAAVGLAQRLERRG
jgi:DNA polymerase III subunit delta